MPRRGKGGRTSKPGGPAGPAPRRTVNARKTESARVGKGLTIAAALSGVVVSSIGSWVPATTLYSCLRRARPRQGQSYPVQRPGQADPPEQNPKVVVSVACQELIEGEWEDLSEVPPADSCEKCFELTAQHTISATP